eukprot:768376-Hanusia_phi.AAC.2
MADHLSSTGMLGAFCCRGGAHKLGKENQERNPPYQPIRRRRHAAAVMPPAGHCARLAALQ